MNRLFHFWTLGIVFAVVVLFSLADNSVSELLTGTASTSPASVLVFWLGAAYLAAFAVYHLAFKGGSPSRDDG